MTTTDSGSRASADEVLARIALARPEWVPLARGETQMDCYGFVLAFYREAFGLELQDLPDQYTARDMVRWFRQQEAHWVCVEESLSYCVVGMGQGQITHVGVYHPSGSILHVAQRGGIVGQHVDVLRASGYTLIQYYAHRSMPGAHG